MEPLAPVLGVVIVNYRGVDDVLECLESVLRSTIPLRVVVVDNASGDGSSAAIEAWARGDRLAPEPSAALAHLSYPPVSKPLALARCPGDHASLTLIDAPSNGGFAAGCNIGLRCLLADPVIEHVWLLNPDTVVLADAAAALLAQLRSSQAGMCGTQVRFYHHPNRTQALNGQHFDIRTGASRGLHAGLPIDTPFEATEIARQTDFVLGASLGVSRRFLDEIGLMNERYFLYFEEVDWAWRARGRFTIAFADAAIIYHKEGGSIGSSSRRGARSSLSEYYLLRSRHAFVSQYRPWLLPVHVALSLGLIVRRLLRRQPSQAAAMLRALLGRAY